MSGKVYKNVTLVAIKWLSTSSSWSVRKWKVTVESVLWGSECALSVKDTVGHCCFPERVWEKHSHPSRCFRTFFPMCFHEGRLKADCICSHMSRSRQELHAWQCGDTSLSLSFLLSARALPCGIFPSSAWRWWQVFCCRPPCASFRLCVFTFSCRFLPASAYLNSILLDYAECLPLIIVTCAIHLGRRETGTEDLYQDR